MASPTGISPSDLGMLLLLLLDPVFWTGWSKSAVCISQRKVCISQAQRRLKSIGLEQTSSYLRD